MKLHTLIKEEFISLINRFSSAILRFNSSICCWRSESTSTSLIPTDPSGKRTLGEYGISSPGL